MCGLVGFLQFGSEGVSNLETLSSMADCLMHRGPDDFGFWFDSNDGINLGHRRLAIVDLSPAGHQPMQSFGKRFVIAFNGEIYNHLELRNLLKQSGFNMVWSGDSDTETLLACVEVWGLNKTLQNAIGMFAIALWDKHEKTLLLARDRMGEKPLYYGWQHKDGESNACGVFLFASELKALKQHPYFNSEINRDALCLLMRHNHIPAPYTIYKNIAKLEPGCILSVSLAKPVPVVSNYWSFSNVVQTASGNLYSGTLTEAVDDLECLLKNSVKQQMTSDVPLGAFLSGGIDSSTIVALMQSQSTCPVKTFSIGFNEVEYNEAKHAKAIANHLGTDHTELYVTSQQAMNVIPKLPNLYCEPFSDSSQIPTFLVSQLARQDVTVALSGDAGDELFGGYNRYILTNKLWKHLSVLPIGLRSIAARGLCCVSTDHWNTVAKPLQSFFPKSYRQANLGDKLHKAAEVLASPNLEQLYLGFVSQWSDPASIVIGGSEPSTKLTGNAPILIGLDDIQRMMALDAMTYLPDDILVKVDRAAMGVSLESRVPFLDHRVVEFAWRLPLNFKLRDGVGKWVLREVLYRHVPKALIERPKMGFGVPIGDWLRGPLRDWAEALLDAERLKNEGYFHAEPIRQKWSEHLSGVRNWQHHLWTVLMFQAWLEDQTR